MMATAGQESQMEKPARGQLTPDKTWLLMVAARRALIILLMALEEAMGLPSSLRDR